ncbi:MAG: hypothetical protein JO170_27670 [Verrucomicrobia bacterium]|nr:hypothetical protein [Verrucomicrobiota bacterium]
MPEITVPEPLEQLLPSENTRLEHLEHIIENFRKSYYKAGAALAEIRNKRLYRATHASFEAYVAERWELSRPRAYDLIDASRVANNLSAVADITTANEFQLRALRDLTAEDQIEVYTKAVERAGEGRVTRDLLEETKEELLASRPTPRPSRRPQPKSEPTPGVMKRALNRIETRLGKQFRAMVEKGHYMPSPGDVVRFSKLNEIEMLHVAKRLKQDWVFKEALDEATKMLSPNDEIRELHSLCVKAGGKVKTTVFSFTHIVVDEKHEQELNSKLKDWPKSL